MEKLEFRALDKDDEIAHREFIGEMMENDGRVVPTAAEIKETDGSFLEWLKRTNNESRGVGITEGRVPATLFFLFRKDKSKILGAVHIRHKLNERLLQFGGNIGYGVVPSERRKGYADKMLKFALSYCKDKLKLSKVLISCDKENIGSAKTILKNGGVLDKENIQDGVVVQKYWIKL